MNLAVIAVIAYGILAVGGGILGYLRAGSKISLISGTISGILLLLAAWLQIKQLEMGLVLARTVTLILVIVFTIRLLKTAKFMPGGLMVIGGLATLVFLFA
jgi:uncharacterized membrane protein (UPF0136 family)